ncbi:hypothetical protein FJZ31_10755 [Candidatus Poribacteria bacterium]|nr:hypothetical protein [Candidatus Poribacteria bacterium]
MSFTCAHHKEITGHIEQTVQVLSNLENLKLEYRFELIGPAWKKRIDEYQQKARDNSTRYVDRRTRSRRYFPTDKGKEILPGGLMDDIFKMLKEDNSMENNVLLLTLGISNLLKISQERQVGFDILLGIVASYADEVRTKL